MGIITNSVTRTRRLRGACCPLPLQVAMQQRASCQVACAPRARLAAALRQHMSLDFFDYSTYRALDVHG